MKFSLNNYMSQIYKISQDDLLPENWNKSGLYMPEIEEMLDLTHLFYTDREKYEKEIQRRSDKES